MPRKITFEDNFEYEDMLDKTTTMKQETWSNVLDRYSAHNKDPIPVKKKQEYRPKLQVKTPTITAILKREKTKEQKDAKDTETPPNKGQS